MFKEKEMISKGIHIFWFRNDLRLEDNKGLYESLKEGGPVRCIYIFDDKDLEQQQIKKSTRIAFLVNRLKELRGQLNRLGSELWIYRGDTVEIFSKMFKLHPISALTFNKGFKPDDIKLESNIDELCKQNKVFIQSFNDSLIFEPFEILKPDNTPYRKFTPYKKKWLSRFQPTNIKHYPSEKKLDNLKKCGLRDQELSIDSLGFENTPTFLPDLDLSDVKISNYEDVRDIPHLNQTTRLSTYLNYGTISIRKVVLLVMNLSETLLSELIWREFFTQIMFHYPHVSEKPFNSVYEKMNWVNDKALFDKWCKGETGYNIVDAGMKQLNETGFMHNRVRMIVASFLTKHLLIDYKWGEWYFANTLTDYNQALNNGNWQWAASTGCDAVPYFRIFNPELQEKKFDPDGSYIRTWNKNTNLPKIIDHVFARKRALQTYSNCAKSTI